MRREACILVMCWECSAWCAAPASADPDVLAQWTLDEGVGQVAGDASGHANHGRARRRPTGPDAADPAWIRRPRRRRRPRLQRLVLRDGPRHRPARAPAARGRRMGAPLGLAGPLALRALQGLASVRPQRLRPVLGLERRHGLLRLERVGVHDLARGLAGDRVGRRDGTTSSAPTTATGCGCGSTARRSARARRRAWPITYTAAAAGSTSAPIAARATSASAARSTTSAVWDDRPADGDDRSGHRAGGRHADAHRHRLGGGSSTAAPGADGAKSQPQGCLRVTRQPPARSRCAARRELAATVRRDGRRVAGVRVLVQRQGRAPPRARAPTARARRRSPCGRARPGA